MPASTCAGASWRRADRRLLERLRGPARDRPRAAHARAEAAGRPPVAEADRLRTALLAAVSHDLRRPPRPRPPRSAAWRTTADELAAEDRARAPRRTARRASHLWRPRDETCWTSARIQAGVLGVALAPVDARRRDRRRPRRARAGPGRRRAGARRGPRRVCRADAVLLQRALVNLLANAAATPAGLGAGDRDERARRPPQIRVIDHGPRHPARAAARICSRRSSGSATPTTPRVSASGLALSKGSPEGMGGTLDPEDTPGGGLTMVIEPAGGRAP